MKGVVKFKHGVDGTELRRDLVEPSPGPGKVKIQVDTATICGSDLHVLFDNVEGDGRYKFPVIIGHEGSGIITEIGQDVTGYKVGDRVVSETTFSTCKHCEYCYTSHYNCCDERIGLGSAVDGFFAEYVIADERSLHMIPNSVSLEAAALLEPLSTVVHGIVDLSNITAGDVVLVSGPGPIGLLAAQVARASGAVVIISGIDQDSQRFNFAENKLGFKHLVNTQKDDLKSYVSSLTSNRGFDIVYECSGAMQAVTQGIECLKKQGQFVTLGVPRQISVDGIYLYGKEIKIQGVRSTIPASWTRSMRLLENGLVDTESLITHRFPLEDWFKGYGVARSGEAVKVALKPSQSS